jgi:hypothetical protein
MQGYGDESSRGGGRHRWTWLVYPGDGDSRCSIPHRHTGGSKNSSIEAAKEWVTSAFTAIRPFSSQLTPHKTTQIAVVSDRGQSIIAFSMN